MTPYSLIFSDIDGTLLDKNRELAQKTIFEIQRVTNTLKIPFILASARMPKAMRHLQEILKINEALICFNGALVIEKNGEVLFNTTIPFEPLDYVANYTLKKDVHVSLYSGDEWLVNKKDYWANREENNTKTISEQANLKDTISQFKDQNKGPHKTLIMGDENKMDELENSLRENFSNQIAIYRSKETYIELNAIEASKKNAIELIAQNRKVASENIIAFGDNNNDIEMLKWVGLGVAVGNAKQEVLEIANKITLTNKKDGVAVFLESFFQ